MIRLRDKQGNEIVPPQDLGFIEICSDSGEVACAVYKDGNGFVHFLTNSSPQASKYAHVFKVKFAKITNIPGELKD